MSKSAEERIAELEGQLDSVRSDNSQLQEYYNQAYRAMEEAQKNSAYYQGQFETVGSQKPVASSVDEDDYDFSEKKTTEAMLDKLIAERLEPRMQAVEKYATDALQQTAGREVDRALQALKGKHPESGRIMEFDRLVMLDAADEVKRRQSLGQPVGDVKEIAIEVAQKKIKHFNTMESKIAEENKKRRETAERKAMVPDMFAAAGFEEMPGAPSSTKEAGDLLEDLVRRRNSAA